MYVLSMSTSAKRRRIWADLLVRRPCLVVAGRLRPAAGGKCRTGRPIRGGGSSHIWPVRFLPRPGLVAFLRRRRVDGVMQPPVPRRRHGGCFRVAVKDYPASLEAECFVDLAATSPVIAVAELVFADEFTVHPGPELCPECLRIPPGEQLEQETFHRRRAPNPVATERVLPPDRRLVQRRSVEASGR